MAQQRRGLMNRLMDHSKGEGEDEVKHFIQTLLQQVNSLHTKVDTLEAKFDELTNQINKLVATTNNNPRVVLHTPSSNSDVSTLRNSDSESEISTPYIKDIEQDSVYYPHHKTAIDYLDINNDNEEMRSRQSSAGSVSSRNSTDSGYLQVSVTEAEIRKKNPVNTGVEDNFDSGISKSLDTSVHVQMNEDNDSVSNKDEMKTSIGTGKGRADKHGLGAEMPDIKEQIEGKGSINPQSSLKFNGKRFESNPQEESTSKHTYNSDKHTGSKSSDAAMQSDIKRRSYVKLSDVHSSGDEDTDETDSDDEDLEIMEPSHQKQNLHLTKEQNHPSSEQKQRNSLHQQKEQNHASPYLSQGEPEQNSTYNDSYGRDNDVKQEKPTIPLASIIQQQHHKQQQPQPLTSSSKPPTHNDETSDADLASSKGVNHDNQTKVTNNTNLDESDEDSDLEQIRRHHRQSANFGKKPPQRRPRSPIPSAKSKIRTPYSYFKRTKTVLFEDNRARYFDKLLEIESFGGAEDMEPMVSEYQRREPMNEFPVSSDQPEEENQPNLPRNNQQIPDSGFKNEHGPEDNRFVEDAHIASVHHMHDQGLGNLSLIRPNHPPEGSTEQEVQQSSNQIRGKGFSNGPQGPERKVEGASHGPARLRRVTDDEIQNLIGKEKQKALDCMDPKSLHGIDTVICLDTSASMVGEPLNKAKQFIIDLLEGLDESAAEYELEENVALVTFGKQNKVLQHLTNNYDLVRNSLESVEADSPSPVWLGIGLCLTELSTRGGACVLDSMKVLPRIIIISDYFASMKNFLLGPDIRQMDQKGYAEVAGIIEKNRNCVSSFDFVIVGTKTNQMLLDKIAQDRLFTTDDAIYLSQFFRAQDTINILLTQRNERDVDETVIKKLTKERGLVAKSERDVMKTLRGITVQVNEEAATSLVPTSPESLTVEIDNVEEPAFGTRMKANPDWVGYHSRKNMSAAVIAPRRQGCLKVLWDDGTQERLKYGVTGEHEILLDDTEPDIDENIVKIGTVVERGKDWRWGDQDGGAGNIGVICNFDPDKKVVSVLWEKGGQGNYRYGYRKSYDVVMRAVLQREREATEKLPFWQMEVGDDEWMFFNGEVNKSIETKYNSTERSTFLVNIEETSYRISIKSMSARNTASNNNHAIRRLDLTKQEQLSMATET